MVFSSSLANSPHLQGLELLQENSELLLLLGWEGGLLLLSQHLCILLSSKEKQRISGIGSLASSNYAKSCSKSCIDSFSRTNAHWPIQGTCSIQEENTERGLGKNQNLRLQQTGPHEQKQISLHPQLCHLAIAVQCFSCKLCNTTWLFI